ncbi:uncharacterized protein JN550_005166 [Neoarthrinium moseri]|uniref:uncharacterized protein n=1 Tax=Neoarthrinium moseri TaxID=1658444 RepID=UPI001FDCE5C5|nr:uncharacterized protein JN550_005166 [Neoarthrinium moseri]KAI1870623.1 hypothetical protein JN550_005166 [Neoarthrinium moseri]
MENVYTPADLSTYSDVCPEEPDPHIREIADLMTEWFQLFIDMRYLDAGDVAFPPHRHQKIDTSKPAAYGFAKDVVDLWQMLPYRISSRHTNWNFGSDGDEFLSWSEFLNDLRAPDTDWWQATVDPFFRFGAAEDVVTRDWNHEDGPYIRPWYAVLTQVGNHGSVMVLNTRNYHMWFIQQLGGTADPALHERPHIETGKLNENDLDQYPSRPAAEFLRDMISRFRDLTWIPGGLYEPSPDSEDPEDVDYYTNFKELYKKCGWPEKFDPLLFDRLRSEGGTAFSYHKPTPEPTERVESYSSLGKLYYIMANAREIVQQQIHHVDAAYRLDRTVVANEWERNALKARLAGAQHVLEPMKRWEDDQVSLRSELEFRVSDLEALRTRSGRYAGPGWAGVSDAEIRRLYDKAAAADSIATLQALLRDKDAYERAVRVYEEAKKAAKETPQEAWNAMAEDYRVWENDDWKERWSILGSGTTVVDLKTVIDEDLSWQELQRRIVYELEKNEDRSWRGERLWRNNEGKVDMVLG